MPKKTETTETVETTESTETAETAETKPADDKMAKVECIVDTQPWTEEKPLELGEVAHVSEEVAGVLLHNKHVKRVK